MTHREQLLVWMIRKCTAAECILRRAEGELMISASRFTQRGRTQCGPDPAADLKAGMRDYIMKV